MGNFSELIDQMQQESDPEKLVSLLHQKSKRYPLAITQNLKLANDWNTVKKTKGFYFDLGQEIERELLDGTLSISSDGEVQFQPHKAPSVQLPIHITASIVKTLSSLILVIKHTLKENELIIIDEPEMNLHPDSQIVFAQLLAKLLNNGIRVLLSTHSDYIIRELNNMIMHDAVIQRGMQIPNYNKARLSKDHIGVYYFAYQGDEVEVNELTVRDTGFEVPSIDQVVEQQNKEADELFDKLYYTDDE